MLINFKSTIVLFSILMAFQISSSSQESSYYTTQYTTENGLPHNQIDAILQDQSGFIWLATWNGLSRFDGNDFVNYKHVPDDSTSVPYFSITDICCDRYNNIWVTPYPEFPLGLYDRKNDRFISYSINAKGKNHIQSERFSMCLDPSGTLWIIGKGGVERFDHKSNSFSPINFDRHIPKKKDEVLEITDLSLMFDNKNNFWFYNKDKLFMAELTEIKNSPIINIVRDYHFENNVYCNNRFKFFTLASGSILCISPFGLYYCQNPSNIFSHLETDELTEQFDLPDTIEWFTPGKIHFRMGVNGIDYAINLDKNERVSSTFVDKVGNLWYSSQNKETLIFQGFKKVTFLKNNFKNLFFNDLIPNDPTVFSICKTSSNELILCTKSAGLIKWDPKTGKSFRIPEYATTSFPEGILTDYNENIWVTYDDNNLVKYNDKLNHPVSILPMLANKMGIEFITRFKVLQVDLQNNIIVGGAGGLAIFNPEKFYSIYLLSLSDHNQVRSVYVNEKNDLVIGTQTNLIYVDRKTNFMTESHLPGQNKYWIESICQYNDSTYWLGLLGGGICEWNKNQDSFYIYTSKDGLCNNTVYSILKDKTSNLWISTDEGISCFNPGSELFINYGVNEGLKVNEFNSGACFQAADGEMFFGGVQGVVRFYPDSILKTWNADKSRLIITDFKVSGITSFFKKAIYESDTIQLDAGTDNFQIGFVLLDFNKPDRIKYRYLLEGYNKVWIPTDHKHRFVNYYNLKPGKYRFKVEATDHLGNWSKQKMLTIFIPAKYYQTFWFKGLLLLVGLLLIILIAYNRYHVLILKEKRKEDQLRLALKESKLEILRKQLNPHFIYNSLNSINYYISLNDKIKANQFITDFARLMRNILDNSSKEMIDFEKELESLEDYLMLEKVRFGDKFEYEINVDENINRMAIQIMPSMVQPFAENAIIHGLGDLKNRKGRLSINFTPGDENYISCLIEDDGIGRKKSESIRVKDQKKRKSRGMDIIAERLTIFNTINGTGLKINIENVAPDQEETGTRVIIQIPAKQNQ